MVEILTWKQRGTFLGMASSKGGSKEGAGGLRMHVAHLGCRAALVSASLGSPRLLGFLLGCSFLRKNKECICWEPGRCFLGLLSQKCMLIALGSHCSVKVLGHCGPRALLKALGLGKGENEARGSCAS